MYVGPGGRAGERKALSLFSSAISVLLEPLLGEYLYPLKCFGLNG